MSRAEEQRRNRQPMSTDDQEDASKIDQIAKMRGWFRPEDNSIFYSIVQNHLAEKLTLEEATKELLTPIDDKINAERLDDVNFLDLWYSIIHSARRINFREISWHRVLVELVVAFKKHSIPGNEKYNYLYSSLTSFTMACREAYNDQPSPGSSSPVETSAWVNLNMFFALLVGNEVVDLSIYAIWAMRQALETPHSDDEQSAAAQKYDTYVPTAAVWTIGAFRVLCEKEEDLTPKDRKFGNPAKGGELWKGKAEFSKQRWEFWRERFAEVGKMDGVSDGTRTVARDAVNAMERAATFEKV